MRSTDFLSKYAPESLEDMVLNKDTEFDTAEDIRRYRSVVSKIGQSKEVSNG